MLFPMRTVKIWCGGMLGLAGGFVVMLVVLRGLVLTYGERVTTGTTLCVLVVSVVSLVVGQIVGSLLAARLTAPDATALPRTGKPWLALGLDRRSERPT